MLLDDIGWYWLLLAGVDAVRWSRFLHMLDATGELQNVFRIDGRLTF